MPCAVIALGSNLGDRFKNIELALRLLEAPSQDGAVVDVVDTSFLYETAPMYVTDQPAFINCACLVETNLEPLKLLGLLKEIETLVGRVPGVRFGPRAVDLDIVFYDDQVIDTRSLEERNGLDNLIGQLVVPHPRLAEREFVLRPLNDMIPEYEHPVLRKTVKMLLSEIPLHANTQPMLKVIPFPCCPTLDSEEPYSASIGRVPTTLTYWTHPHRVERRKHGIKGHQTHVMAIINVTPDSFSDGSLYNTVPTALSHACDAVAAGASAIDIGGYSTRPKAEFVSPEQEIARVCPVVKAIREDKRVKDVIISVDTFRPEVAEAAILSGANCINDVYAFMGPEWWKGGECSERVVEESEDCLKRMKAVAKKYAVPVILMHSRADAGQNKNYDAYSYAEEQVVEGVRVELGEKVERVVKGKGGVRRWMVIADIGIGFSKSINGNLELLRNAGKVTADVPVGKEREKRNPLAGFPQLVGASRKSFLGVLLSEGDQGRTTEPKERTWATAAAVACSVEQGALVIRVHDVREMMDVVRISDAVWC